MKLIQYCIPLLMLFLLSCDWNGSSNRRNRNNYFNPKNHTAPAVIDSASIYDAQKLQVFLLSDTVNLDSIRELVKNQKCLDIPVIYESYTRGGVGRNGGLLHTLTSLMSTEHEYSFTSLQSTLFFNPKNKLEVLSLLLSSGADPNVITADSVTSLDWANIRDLNLEYCDTLIKYGADPTLMNLRHCDTDMKRIDFFIEKGASPKTINWSSFLTIRYKNQRGNRAGKWKKGFYKILNYGANPQKIDPFELRNFVRSDYYFDPEIMDSLISNGLDLNKPLEFHVNGGPIGGYEYWLDYVIDNHFSEKLLVYLIEKGAKKTRSGYNVYETAKRRRFSEDVLEVIESKFGK